jgi:hypothetical protein
VRHKRSQKPAVVYTLVDEGMGVVDSLMRISSRNEDEFGNLRQSTHGTTGVRANLLHDGIG